MSAAQPADAMAHVDAVDTAGSLRRTVMNGEGYGIALVERHHLGPRLHARPLFRQHELTTGEVLAWSRQQDGEL